MSISRVDFFSQVERETYNKQQQAAITRARNYLLKHNINYELFDVQKYVNQTLSSVESILDISDCYINKQLKSYQFESTFDGLIVYVCGAKTKIYTGDSVDVKPMAIVYIGEHNKDHTISTTTITRPTNVSAGIKIFNFIEPVENIILKQTNNIITCVKNIKIKLL